MIVHQIDNKQGSNDASPVPVIITGKAKKGEIREFEEWMGTIIHEAMKVEGPIRFSRLEI